MTQIRARTLGTLPSLRPRPSRYASTSHGLQNPSHGSEPMAEVSRFSLVASMSGVMDSITRMVFTLLVIVASLMPLASAQACIPLSGSTQCPAFNASSISTNRDLVALFPFLSFVSSRNTFDTQLSQYVNTLYVQTKYQQLLGCTNVTLTNTTVYYARYTTSALCNAIVQNSVRPCNLNRAAITPLCADSCAKFAISEEEITISQLCGTTNPNFMSQIRADFTNCALPSDSLSGTCITAASNEPSNCGFSTNLQGLCGFCASSSPNATDSCCVGSDVASRCQGVPLPSGITSLPPLFPSTSSTSFPTASNTSAAAGANPGDGSHLSGGAIAGIVIGGVIGAALLIGLLILLCLFVRRRRANQKGGVFKQPTPRRSFQQPDPAMAYATKDTQVQPPPGGRVTRMAAIEGYNDPEPAGAEKLQDSTESDSYGDSPESRLAGGLGGPVTGRRNGSLSSASVFGMGGENNGNQYSSPEGMASAQSEQLPFFKDYYSQDDIHPGDKVSTLWAYQPRAADEFGLERGDMIKVVGIWDDGWATGLRIPDRAEDYDGKHKPQRDSGVSSSSEARSPSQRPMGEIKAFPLVCVCLPEHWRRTIEGGDSSSPSDSHAGGHLSSI